MTLPTLTLTDGVRTLPLVYTPGNVHKYMALYGGRIAPPEPRAAWHTPDEFPRELINLFDDIRVGFFEATIGLPSTGDDDLAINDIITLRRWVDGANQQAARYYTHDQDVNRIYLEVQRKDASIKTIQPVIYGWIDDSEAHYDPISTINNVAYRVGITLYFEPYGEAEGETTLYNHVANAALYFESSSSGLAANWAEVGTPVTTLDTAVCLVNGQSQKVVATTDDHGIHSDTFSMATTGGYGYVWIRVTSGNVTVELYDSTAAAVRDTQTINSTDSNNISDKSATDDDGNTWYRVPIGSASGLTSGNNHRVRALQTGATAATFYVNLVYFRLGGSSVPGIWCSQSSIANRGDQSTANPERINTIDVWGVPGDIDGLIEFEINPTATGGTELFAIGAFRDKQDKHAVAFDHWQEGGNLSTDSAKTVNGSFANVADANASNGNVAQYTSSNATNQGHKAISTYSRTPQVVFVRAMAGQAGATMTLDAPTNGGPSPLHDVQSVTLSSSQYRFHRLGIIHRVAPEGQGNLQASSCNIKVVCANTLQTINIDCVLLLPVQDGFLLYQTLTGDLATGTMGANINLTVSGIEQRSWLTEEVLPTGVYPTVQAGNRVTRFYLNRIEDDTGTRHYLTDTFLVTLSILPRTRHLLGTL